MKEKETTDSFDVYKKKNKAGLLSLICGYCGETFYHYIRFAFCSKKCLTKKRLENNDISESAKGKKESYVNISLKEDDNGF